MHPQLADSFRRFAPLTVDLQSMTPPKTPVCFASMFSGAPPEVHGIRRYERPVLEVDTLFDAAVRGGLSVALVAVKDCSIDLIFRNRPLDYYSEPYDPEVTSRTLELLTEDKHQLIISYQQEYDDNLHRESPFSGAALAIAERHAADFLVIAEAASKAWKGRRWGIAVTPDHGAHIDPATGRGDHCDEIPEDMLVTHFWGFGQ